MLFQVLIVMSSLLLFAKMTSSTTVNYATPFASRTASPCSDMLRPCLTSNEYISDLDEYFINNTVFYFYPGIRRLALDEFSSGESIHFFSGLAS